MRQRILIAVVIALALVTMALTSSVVIAQPDEVEINPVRDCGRTFTVDPGQSVVLSWGWLAGSPGVVRAFLRAESTEYWLDDTLIFDPPELAAQYWGPVESTDPVESCGERAFLSRWEYQYTVPVAPAKYVLYTVLKVDHPVTDLCDLNPEDGKPDLYRGQIDCALWIHVVGP